MQGDAIEKKPVFHFQPGAKLFSVGSSGCNLRCAFCQNYMLSDPTAEPSSTFLTPHMLVQEANDRGVHGIAFTYNEPVIWSEYIIDVAKEARSKGLFVLINTNGYIEEEAAKDLLAAVQVAKVDIKGFSDQSYLDICQGHLDPVLRTCKLALRTKVHLELSYLLIPGKTDSPKMLALFVDWVRSNLSLDVPLHLYQFHPSFRMFDVPEESIERMREVRKAMLEAGLQHVYLGGTKEDEGRDTLCPKCGEVMVKRGLSAGEKVVAGTQEVSRFCPSFSKVKDRSVGSKCPRCGNPVNIVLWKQS